MISRIFRTLVPVVAGVVTLSPFAAANLQAQVAPSLVQNPLTQPIDENSLVTLKGTVHPLANAANDRGAAPDSMPLDRLQIVLKRSAAQESALQQLVHDQHTPGTASYHKWLTPAQFGQQFGPSDQDIATVQAWLASQGFNVEKVNAGKQTLEVSGNVAQFRSAFHAQIHKYSINGETHYANASDPKIPAALAPVFGGFASLNNFRPRRLSHVLGQAAYNPKTGQTTPQWTMGTQAFALAPGDFAVQYDVPSTSNGAGQTIAVLNDSNINVATVNQFRSLFNLPSNPPQVIIDGNDPGVDGINNPGGPNFDSPEAYLDVEWSGAVAPNATIDLVIGADTTLETGFILAAEHAVYGNIAPIITASFGLGCEQQLGSGNQFVNALWEQAAAQGITVIVATGDSGSAACDLDTTQYYAVGGATVSGLASTPWNVAVGGTDFYFSDYATGGASVANYWNTTPTQNPSTSLKGVVPEQPWNDSQYGLNIFSVYSDSGNTQTSIAGGGGGASACATGTADPTTGVFTACTAGYAKPAWQIGTGVPADKVRDIPDVSLFAANGLNEAFYPICYVDGDCQPASGSSPIQITGVGGTSASAPAFAGIMALVDQKYGRQGQADYVLYPLAKQYPAAFHDVVNGTISVPCNITTVSDSSGTFSPVNCIAVKNPLSVTDPTFGNATEGQIGTGTTPEYNAATGYDLATGLGTIDTAQLINNWGNITFAGTSVTLTSPTSGASFSHGSAVTFTGAVTGTGSSTPSGSVAIESSSTEPVNQGQTTCPLDSTGAFTNCPYNYLPGGTYDVWANFGGDGANGSAQSPKTQITITPEASTTYFNVVTPGSTAGSYTPIASGGSFPYGTQLVLSAQPVSTTYFNTCINTSNPPSSCTAVAAATGTVQFSDGGTPLNTAVLNAEGDAEYAPPTAFTVGSHSVTASYSGDASYNASSASAVTFTIAKNAPSVFVTGAANSSGVISVQQGQNLTLTVLVESGGVGLAPTGSVSISGGPSGTPTSATLTSTVDPFYGTTAGIATITIPTGTSTTSSLAPDQRRGFGGWLAGSGAALACIFLFTIPARRRTWRGMLVMIALALFTVSATIGCGSGSGSSKSGGTGSGGTTGGGGTTVGNYTISVSYGGDANYTSASGSTAITIATASTLLTSTTSVTSTSTSTSPTAAIGVDVTVGGVSGKAAPTGTVVLYTGSLSPNSQSQGIAVELAQGTLTAGSGSSSTVALSFSSQSLLQGANLLTVLYEGDTNYASSSTTLNLSNPLSDFSLIPSNSLVGVAATGSANDTLNLASANGFNGTVALTCTPPAGVSTLTCSINPASVSLTGTGNSATATLSITGAAATPGNYQVLITGTSGSTVHTLAVTAAVQ